MAYPIPNSHDVLTNRSQADIRCCAGCLESTPRSAGGSSRRPHGPSDWRPTRDSPFDAASTRRCGAASCRSGLGFPLPARPGPVGRAGRRVVARLFRWPTPPPTACARGHDPATPARLIQHFLCTLALAAEGCQYRRGRAFQGAIRSVHFHARSSCK